MGFRYTRFCLWSLALCLGPVAVGASLKPLEWLTDQGSMAGSNFVISVAKGSNQLGPSLAHNAVANQFLLVWSDDRGITDTEGAAASDADIFAKLLDGDGQAIVPDFPVASAPFAQSSPGAAYNHVNQEYLVVWEDRRDFAAGGVALYGQRIGADASLISNNFMIAASAPSLRSPAVTYNGHDNQYLVVWARGQHIYSQRVGPDGRLLPGPITVSTTQRNQTALAVAYNPRDREYLVVWVTSRFDFFWLQSVSEIYAQRLAPDGLLISGEIFVLREWPSTYQGVSIFYNAVDHQFLLVFSSAASARSARLQPDGRRASEVIPFASTLFWNKIAVAHNAADNEYLAVWTDSRNYSQGRIDIYGRRLGPDGRPLADAFAVSQTVSGQRLPAILFSGSDRRFLVVWEDLRSASTRGVDLYGQIIRSGGVLQGENYRIAPEGEAGYGRVPGARYGASVAYNSVDQQYLVVWSDGRPGVTGGLDIYGQLLGSEGQRLSSNFPISIAPGIQFFPVVAYNRANNEYLVVWEDGRIPSAAIYGQRVAADGRLLGDEVPMAQDAHSQAFGPTIAYNDTNNQYLVAWSDGRNYPRSGLDLYGRIVGSDGRPVSSELAIAGAPGLQWPTSVVHNGVDNEYLVVWTDERDPRVPGFAVYGRRLAHDGSPILQDFPIAKARAGQRSAQAVFNSRAREYMVIWSDGRGPRPETEIYGQRVGADGALRSTNFPVLLASRDLHVSAGLAYNPSDNTYLVVSDRQPSGGFFTEIAGQRIAADGRGLGPVFTIARGPGGRGISRPVYDQSAGRYLVIWPDRRNSDFNEGDIYGQLVR